MFLGRDIVLYCWEGEISLQKKATIEILDDPVKETLLLSHGCRQFAEHLNLFVLAYIGSMFGYFIFYKEDSFSMIQSSHPSRFYDESISLPC